ncbi:Protein SDA1-like protein, partial [Fragariocoptes setiger]
MYNPAYVDKDFETLIMFLAHVSHCYPNEMKEFPVKICEMLRNYSSSLNRDTRMSCCKALVLMRAKGLLDAMEILPLFFELSNCRDKALRTFLRQIIISDIKTMNSKKRDERANKEIQRFMFSQLEDEKHDKSSKMAIDVMIELYRKNVWRDKDNVNQIAQACLSRSTRILASALKFFIGQDEEAGASDEDSSDDDAMENLRETELSNKFNRKTRKRQKAVIKVKKDVKKALNKEKRAESFNFSALHLIHDPQGLAEKLLECVETTGERFEIKLMMLNLISRLIGIHELILFNFYHMLVRFLQPHQREVTKILQYAAQAAHQGVPPEEIDPVLKTIINNFVSERNSTEVMTVGLNSIRELCTRCPLIMSKDVLHDLAGYQKYKNKNVAMAAKSIVKFYRLKNPELLKSKDRGRQSLVPAELRVRPFGQRPVFDGTKVEGDSLCVIESDMDDSMASNVDTGSEDDMELGTEDEMYSDEDGEFEGVQDYIDGNDEDLSNGSSSPSRKPELEEFFEKDKVRLEDIERLYKKPKHNKQTRLATVIDGREGREKFGHKKSKMNPKSSTNNKDKAKFKAFGMVKHKIKRKNKKKTFQEKQREMQRIIQAKVNAKKKR